MKYTRARIEQFTQDEFEMKAAMVHSLFMRKADAEAEIKAIKGNSPNPKVDTIAEAYRYANYQEELREVQAEIQDTANDLGRDGFPCNVRIKYTVVTETGANLSFCILLKKSVQGGEGKYELKLD